MRKALRFGTFTLLSIAGAGLYFGLRFGLGSAPLPFQGFRSQSALPDFELSTLEGPSEKVVLSERVDEHPVLLVFWATWCPSCVEEIPTLNRWHRLLGPKGLQILSINVKESPDQIRRFREDHPMEYPVLLDSEGRVADRFGLGGLPVSILLERGGKILYYCFSLPHRIDQLMELR